MANGQMPEQQQGADPQRLEVKNFRGGIDTYNRYSSIQNPASGVDIKNATLLDGTLTSRKTLEKLYSVPDTVYSVFDHEYNGTIYTFYTTSTGLFLNGVSLDSNMDGFATMFHYRDYVYILNKQKFIRYDLYYKTTRIVGLPDPGDNITVGSPKRKPGPNSLVLHDCDSTSGVSVIGAGGAISADTDDYLYGGTSVTRTFASGDVEAEHGLRFNIAGGGSPLSLDGDPYDSIPLFYRILSGFVKATIDIPKSSFSVRLVDNTGTDPTINIPVQAIPANTWTYFRVPLDQYLSTSNKLNFTITDWKYVDLLFKDLQGGYDLNVDMICTNSYIWDPGYDQGDPLSEVKFATGPMDGDYFYAMTAVDRFGLESQGSIFYQLGNRFIPDSSGLITSVPAEGSNFVYERLPFSLDYNSFFIDTSNDISGVDTLEGYSNIYNATVKFRVYRKGGSATGWRYVGDYHISDVKSNIRDWDFTKGVGTLRDRDDFYFKCFGDDFDVTASPWTGTDPGTPTARDTKYGPTPTNGSIENGFIEFVITGGGATYTYEIDGQGAVPGGALNNYWKKIPGTNCPCWYYFDTNFTYTDGDTWVLQVYPYGQQLFWDDNPDSTLTVLGTWENNADPQDRKSDVLFWDKVTGRLFIGFGPYLYYSESTYPDNVPYINYIQLPEDIVSITRDSLSLIAKTRTGTYRVNGDFGELTTNAIIGGTGAVTPWSSALVRGLCFTYSDGRITGIDAASANFAATQAVEIDIGLGLYEYLKEEDPEAYASYNPITRDSILVHKGILYIGQADNLQAIEFTRSDLITYKSTFYSLLRKRMLYAGDGGIYIETDQDATFTWKSVEYDHGIPYVKKDLRDVNVVYEGELTFNTYADGELVYTKVLPSHSARKKEFFRVPSHVRGILMQYELIGSGTVESLTVNAHTMNP